MRTIAAYSVSDDQAHIEVINGVEHDDAVRGLCRHDKIASIAEVDFEGVKELDFFLPPSLQWWPPLKMGCLSVTRWRRLHAAKEVSFTYRFPFVFLLASHVHCHTGPIPIFSSK
ncbi:24-methylenesterol C-methyltransferase 2-like [Lolium rigidum]|uniref:24-methylenesterol C-methyltransferase 2-like n=1 Tax=Lolium rigidum TaxID=89674 RepID=UPI001F5DA6EE|nr:24-methylenesterol C-methyltransferase 2-like [Lolium rigidum]